MIQRTHKIALDINNKQRTHLAKCAGVARFAYNWALSEWGDMYEAHKEDISLPKPNQYLLRRNLNAIKREKFPWIMEVTKCAPQEAIIDLGRAFENFFAGRASYPVYKRKGVHDSFRISAGFFEVGGKGIRIPKIGWLKMREELRYENAKLVRVTISRRADRWYASIVCELPESAVSGRQSPEAAEHVVGIDAGVHAYVTSDGDMYETPRSYRNAERRLGRAQQSLSRKQKGSKNQGKQCMKVAKLHARAADIRADFIHKMTTDIVSRADTIVIEDLNVKGMIRNKYLSKSIADASFGEFRRRLSYKADWYGKTLVIADRFYPSSKLCSACGAKTKRLTLSIRDWVCESCGAEHDRDLNAAVNLRRYAESSPVSACGEFFASAIAAKCGIMASSLCEAGTKHQIAS
jgi:putative transposase